MIMLNLNLKIIKMNQLVHHLEREAIKQSPREIVSINLFSLELHQPKLDSIKEREGGLSQNIKKKHSPDASDLNQATHKIQVKHFLCNAVIWFLYFSRFFLKFFNGEQFIFAEA